MNQDFDLSEIPYKVTIESFRHNDFTTVMELDGLTQEDIIASLNTVENRYAVFKAGQSAGTSGSFFFFSYDNRFLLKTILPEESKKLQ